MKLLCLEAAVDLKCSDAHDHWSIVGRGFGVIWSELASAAFTIDDIHAAWWPTEEECRDAWESTP